MKYNMKFITNTNTHSSNQIANPLEQVISTIRNCRFLYSMLLLLLMLTVGVNGAWGQSAPVEITTADDITNDTKKLYLIQTNAFPSFYIAHQDVRTLCSSRANFESVLYGLRNLTMDDVLASRWWQASKARATARYMENLTRGLSPCAVDKYVNKYKELPLGKLPLGNISYLCGSKPTM